MKLKVLNIIACLFVVACSISSCLDSDTIEYEYSSNASITAFSITDSIITYYPAVVDGKDTTLSTAVIGTDYPFVINQKEGLIYNPDSLPVGTDVSKVVVGITADTYGIYIVAETDSLWEETDSLNFENPIQFKVLSEIGSFGRTYTAKINVHQQEPDSLNWQQVAGNFDKSIRKQKAVYANSNIYVFAEQAGSVVMTMTSDEDGSDWTAPIGIEIPAEADYTSVMVWNSQFYILAENELYASTDGIHWGKTECTQRFSKLLANVQSSNNLKLIGIDTDNHYIESKDGIVWAQCEEMPSEFPTGHYVSVSYALDTNDQFDRIVLVGNSNQPTDTTTVVWTQLNAEDNWTELTTEDKSYACPNLENIGLIHYDNELYVFGGAGQYNGSVEPFSQFYISEDNGIAWEAITSKFMFPEEFKTLYEEAEGNYSYVVDDRQFIWIMWGNTGEVWKGRLNRLGFQKQ